MKMQKGICVESKGNRSIYLTGDGQFLAGRAVQQIRIGEEGYFYEEQRKAKIKWQPIWVPATAAFAVLLLFLSVLLPSDEAFAYVQVEINPGVELGFNEEYRVISVRDLNADGEILIDKLGEWKNHSLDEVLAKVIALSVNDKTEEVTITTVGASANSEAKKPVEKVVTAAAASAVVASNVDIHLKKATRKQWRESVKESVPVGQKIDKFTPVPSKQQAPADGAEKQPNKNSKVNEEQKLKDGKPVLTKEPKKDSAPAGKIDEAPLELPKKAAPQEREKKETPPGQEKKAVPLEPKKKATPSGQEKKAIPGGQQKKQAPLEPKEKPAGQQKKTAPVEPKPKKTPPGLEKKAVPPKQEKKAAPKAQEKKQHDQSGQTKKDKKPQPKKGGQDASKKGNSKPGPSVEKKKSAPQKKNMKEKE